MTWFAQVRHVAAKDLRQARWLVATYGLVVLVATARSLSWRGTGFEIFQTASLLVVCIGMLLVAITVQADSPTRSDAFWATRPFYPSAILVAKYCLAIVLVIGLGLIGQTLGLRARGVSAHHMLVMLGQSAWEYALWLLLAMIAAALAKDLPSAVVTLVIVLVVLVGISMVCSQWIPDSAAVPVHAILVLIGVAGVAGGTALLALVYKRRDTRRRIWFAGLLALASLFAMIFLPAPSARPLDAPASVPRASLGIGLLDYDRLGASPQIQLVIHTTPGNSRQNLTLRNVVVVAQLRDGSSLRLPVFDPGISLRPDASPGFDNVSWLREGSQTMSTIEVAVPMTDDQRVAVARGVTNVALDGRVWVSDAHVAATLPLVAGASAIRDDSHVRIVRWSHGFGDVALTIEKSAVQGPQPPDLFLTTMTSSVEIVYEETTQTVFWGSGLNFALLNPMRRQAIALATQSTRSLKASLVLPGPDLTGEEEDVATTSLHGAPGAPIDDDWLRSARLMIIDWVPRGSYPVHAEYVAPTPPPSKK